MDLPLSYAQLAETNPTRQACMLTKTIIDTRATNPVISDQAQQYLDQIRDEFTVAFDKAKVLGELPTDANTSRLARRFHANMTALRIETPQGVTRQEVADLAEDLAQELESLREK